MVHGSLQHRDICWICSVMWHPLLVTVNFQVVFLTGKSICMICILCMGLLHMQQCEIIVFCIITLSMSYFFFISCTNFTHMESVYWFDIVFCSHNIFPLLCRMHLEWIFYSVALLSFICYEHWSALCVVYSRQFSAFCVVSLTGLAISRQIYWGADQIWQSYREESMTQSPEEKADKYNKNDDAVLVKSLFGRDL